MIKNFFKKHYQSIIYFSFATLVILGFLYAICFMSNMWILKNTGYNVKGVYGSDSSIVYEQLNLFNNLVFISSLVLIVLFALAMLFGNKSRHKYYTSNFIFGYLAGIFAIVFSAVVLVNAGKSKEKLLYASYGEFVYVNGNSAQKDLGNFVNVIIPDGVKEKFESDAVGLITYTNPYSVDTPNFTIDKSDATINLGIVLYVFTAISGLTLVGLTTYKLISRNKKEVKEEM